MNEYPENHFNTNLPKSETKLEYILTHSYKADMISYLNQHPADFDEVVALAVANKKNISWRAAWLLWSCMAENDQRLQKHLKKLIDKLPTSSDNQLRELLIILQRMELPVNYEGKLFGICVDVWEKTGKQPSVRYNAFKLMVKIAKKNPALINELFLLSEPQYLEALSGTVKKSVLKMLACLSPNL
jgi:hypothetical protein